MMFEIGAIKLKDGFFIGDIYAAKDLQFICLNKITHIVNCAPYQIANQYSDHQINYLSLNWTDSDTENFNKLEDQIQQMRKFLQEALELGKSILIHSLRCQNRALLACACYFIKEFRWSAETSLGFINSRKKLPPMKSHIQIRLMEYQAKHISLTSLKQIIWDRQLIKNYNGLTDEQLILVNTFLNSQSSAEQKHVKRKNENNNKIQWNDRITVGRGRGKLITALIPGYEQLQFNKQNAFQKSKSRPILKKQNKVLKQNLILGNEQQNSIKKKINEAEFKFFNQQDELKDFDSQLDILPIRRNTLDPTFHIKKSKKNQTLFSLYGLSSPIKKLERISKEKKTDLTSKQTKVNLYNYTSKLVFGYRSQKNFKQSSLMKPIKQVNISKLGRPNSGSSIGIKNFIQGIIKSRQQ